MRCAECGSNRYEEVILPSHHEDVGGITVELRNTVHVRRCAECADEETMIPDMRGLVRVVAVCRAMLPIRLEAGDIRLMRRALDMSQKDFANAMEVAPETVSRWEKHGGEGVGSFAEKSVRYGVCALLLKELPHIKLDLADITNMKIRRLVDGEPMPVPVVERIAVRANGSLERYWDPECRAA